MQGNVIRPLRWLACLLVLASLVAVLVFHSGVRWHGIEESPIAEVEEIPVSAAPTESSTQASVRPAPSVVPPEPKVAANEILPQQVMPSALPGLSNSPMPTRGSLPPLKVIKKLQVTLGFDVSRVGPSGLGAVEVYQTIDEGATWDKLPANAAVTRPVSPETRGVGPQTGKVTVTLPKDGLTYGFYLVVKSRAGLGKPGPKPGDVPQVRVEADITKPEVTLFPPQPDVSRSDALVLTWKAEDRNLATNPITLEWSENGREWFFIGPDQLPNMGRYTWPVDAKVPPKVHLRLTVRDTAGNVAVAQTSEPVLVDLSKPEIDHVVVSDE